MPLNDLKKGASSLLKTGSEISSNILHETGKVFAQSRPGRANEALRLDNELRRRQIQDLDQKRRRENFEFGIQRQAVQDIDRFAAQQQQIAGLQREVDRSVASLATINYYQNGGSKAETLQPVLSKFSPGTKIQDINPKNRDHVEIIAESLEMDPNRLAVALQDDRIYAAVNSMYKIMNTEGQQDYDSFDVAAFTGSMDFANTNENAIRSIKENLDIIESIGAQAQESQIAHNATQSKLAAIGKGGGAGGETRAPSLVEQDRVRTALLQQQLESQPRAEQLEAAKIYGNIQNDINTLAQKDEHFRIREENKLAEGNADRQLRADIANKRSKFDWYALRNSPPNVKTANENIRIQKQDYYGSLQSESLKTAPLALEVNKFLSKTNPSDQDLLNANVFMINQDPSREDYIISRATKDMGFTLEQIKNMDSNQIASKIWLPILREEQAAGTLKPVLNSMLNDRNATDRLNSINYDKYSRHKTAWSEHEKKAYHNAGAMISDAIRILIPESGGIPIAAAIGTADIKSTVGTVDSSIDALQEWVLSLESDETRQVAITDASVNLLAASSLRLISDRGLNSPIYKNWTEQLEGATSLQARLGRVTAHVARGRKMIASIASSAEREDAGKAIAFYQLTAAFDNTLVLLKQAGAQISANTKEQESHDLRRVKENLETSP